ncbi:LOW QUALITY PROTEIN: phenylalanyl-tRNA synthetase beta chain [Bacillus sp. JCM 19047]|nr:LOW QUALITY PROTEIN: phenylalanyl-tRNA synthetase beta chain [Bacillus sp. JCM 19047]
MNAFYNKKGIGDVLLLVKEQVGIDDRFVEQHGDFVQISKRESGEVVGINVLNASNYGVISGEGAIDLTDEVQALLKKSCKDNGQVIKLDLEQKPLFVVGYVEACEQHANADKLSVCRVNLGNETVQIVCGAPNVEAGQKVVVAKVGAVMPSGMVIKEAKLRGEESHGMICSAKELGLQDASSEKGILVLPEDRVVGSAFL